MHEALFTQKADKAQLHKLEQQLHSALRAPQPQVSAGTRAAPLHERLVVAHAAAPIVAEAKPRLPAS